MHSYQVKPSLARAGRFDLRITTKVHTGQLLKRYGLPFATAKILVVEIGQNQTMAGLCTTLLVLISVYR